MNASATLVSVHLAGEGKDEIVLDMLPGKFTVTRTDEALTPYGGLAAWSGFLQHLGIIARVPWPLWAGAPTVGCQQFAETTVRLQGWSRERRIVIVRTLKPTNPTPQDLFWETPEDEVAVYVTNLEPGEAPR